MVTPADLDRLRAMFGGDVITPHDDAYDGARRVWNAIYDRRPALIVRPAGVPDVATAIRFGRDRDLQIAVRSGGHSNSGFSTTDGGLVIDLSRMRGVAVDPGRRTARVSGGALLGELDIAAQEHGLVCPVGVVGHTGVAGLTLGGGIGRLQRRFGLTIDNLSAVELVTADGRTVRASATEAPELFWGMRGAGPNFGIVTAFEFKLHPFGPHLHRGMRIYRGSQAREVWSMYRDYGATAPDEVSMILAITRAEPTEAFPESVANQPVLIVAYNHCGDASSVQRDLAPLADGPEPVASSDSSPEYLEIQTAKDLAMGWGHRSVIESAYTNDLRPEAVDALVEHTATAPDGSSLSITLQGGAIARVADDAMAYTGRSAAYDVSADGEWDDPALDEPNTAWVRDALAIVGPDLAIGRYSNAITRFGPDQTRSIYGDAKLERLRALKRAWDPDNVFRLNHNIAP